MTARRERRGVSLIEAILAIFLVGLFMVVLSDLTSSLSRVNVSASKKETVLQILGPVFTLIRADFSQSVKVNEPSGLSTSRPTIDLTRIKPSSLVPASGFAARLPLTLPSANAYAWNPLAPTHLEGIVYDRTGSSLRRKVGTDPAITLAEVKSLEASQLELGLFEIVIEVETGTKVEVLKCLVDR